MSILAGQNRVVTGFLVTPRAPGFHVTRAAFPVVWTVGHPVVFLKKIALVSSPPEKNFLRWNVPREDANTNTNTSENERLAGER